ncbi:MAG: hypothetical protein GTN36_05390 [Candidatus Aenigmarchaeota archaeon]|nr:hypothetical protein [Candidatus Aenigmarchaeota archaeon]
MKFKLTNGDMLDIKNAIANADFFNLEDEYDGEVTDLPSTYLTVYEDSKAKQVRARYNIPEKLSSLINVIHNKITKYVG